MNKEITERLEKIKELQNTMPTNALKKQVVAIYR